MAPPRIVAGPIYRPGEGFEAGWLELVDGRVLRSGAGEPPEAPDAVGVVLPSPVNAHTHVADHVGRGIDLRGRSLAEVVAPPDGLKHRLLRETPPEQLLEGMRRALHEMAATGARAFVDFREQGPEGARLLRAAAEGAQVQPVIFGRVAGDWTDEEAEEVLRVADGYGLSGLGDVRNDVAERAARLARRRDKRFALHLSEAQREDVGRAIDLVPDFVVHLCEATPEDLRALADAGVPAVACPRSNTLFGRRAPVAAMLDAGLVVALGTDNAMFHPLDIWEEARFLLAQQPELGAEAVLDMAIAGGALVADEAFPREWLREGEAAHVVVLEPQGRDPRDAVFGPQPPRVRRVFAPPAKG